MSLDWNTRYSLSRAFGLELSNAGLLATTSYSRPSQRLELDALPLLLAFTTGAAPRDAYDHLCEEWQIDEIGFAEAVSRLVDDGFLVADGKGHIAGTVENPEVHPAKGGFASAKVHFHMLDDTVRVLAYRSAIERWSSGKSVLEIGCGTGILSVFAALAGARKVIAIEESTIADVAEAVVDAHGMSQTVDIYRANSRDVELDEPVDLIIHELFGTDPFHEFLLESIDDARRRFLRPGGRMLPCRLEVACLALELDDAPEQRRTRAVERLGTLGRLYGLDLEPVSRALQSVDAERFARSGRASFDGAKVLSEECALLDIDFHRDPEQLRGQMGTRTLEIQQPGRLDALALYFRAHLDERTVISTSPLAPPTHWGHDLRPVAGRAVSAGDRITLNVDIDTVQGHPCLKVEPR